MHARIFAALLVWSTCFAAPAFAANDNSPRHTISVSGEGEVKAAPDEAQLSAGVVSQAATAADALADNARAMNRVFETLKQLGIPDRSMQTSEFSVSPQYETTSNGIRTEKIIGYQVSNTVSVTVDNLQKLGPTIDVLVGSGANALGGVTFAIHDPKPLEAKAREAAVHDAMEKAATFAKAAGLKLGPIVSISEGSEGQRPVFREMAFAAAPAPPPPTPMAAGEETVSASVSVTFEIP